MQRLRCKTCGCYSMMPVEVAVESEEDELLGTEHESRFFTCHVCGDNWLSVKETNVKGSCTITYVHQMGMDPVLKRIAHMHTPALVSEEMVDSWEYFLGDEEIAESVWRQQLDTRRSILKSICTN